MEAGDIPGRDGDAEEKRINRLAVHEAVKRLPRDLQQLVNMQLEGMTPDEMAEKLERPLSEVTTFLQEAMERLRAFLPDDFMTR
jgi:DNA-directed RNA polymerase specialized sigma24 family protein